MGAEAPASPHSLVPRTQLAVALAYLPFTPIWEHNGIITLAVYPRHGRVSFCVNQSKHVKKKLTLPTPPPGKQY